MKTLSKACVCIVLGLALPLTLTTGCRRGGIGKNLGGSIGNDLVGVWRAEDESGVFYLDFNSNRTFEALGTNSDGILRGEYSLDLSVEPHRLDVRYDSGDECKTIIDFPGADATRMAHSSDCETVPRSFDQADYLMEFRRQDLEDLSQLGPEDL